MNSAASKTFSVIIIFLLSGIFLSEASPTIFSKKKKFGLMDPAGTILHKAEFDSIGDFVNDYALVWKGKKCGVIKNDGSMLLNCKYKEILLPDFSRYYFWASGKDGKYYLTSKERYYTNPYDSVFYAPDKKWYAKRESLWCERTGLDGMRYADFNEAPKIINLCHGYQTFGDKLYNSDGKQLLDKIAFISIQNIGDSKFITLEYSNSEIKALINILTGDLWEHRYEKGYYYDDFDYFVCTTSDKKPWAKIEQNKMLYLSPLQQSSYIYTIKDPANGLMGIQKSNSRILPLECNKIYWTKLDGEIEQRSVYILNLESTQRDLSIEKLVNNLHLNDGFVAIINNGISDLYDSKGNIVAENYKHLCIANDRLTFTENGEKVSMTLEGLRDIKGYDETIRDGYWGGGVGVKKDGKYGIYHEGIGEIIPPLYDSFYYTEEGYIRATTGELVALYDRNGNMLVPPKYKNVNVLFNNDNSRDNAYLVQSISGSEAIIDCNGNTLVPFGKVDTFDLSWYDGCSKEGYKWCWVEKDGNLGIMDLTSFKITVPCIYEPGTQQTSNHCWPNLRVALARELPNKNIVIDVYKITGEKVASRTFTQNQIYLMKYFMEQQLNVQLHLLN